MREISKNFNQENVDFVIKLGGSLLKSKTACKKITDILEKNRNKYRFLIFPGGGDIDNYIENYNDEKVSLSRETFHLSTLLSLDQTALLFSNYSDNLSVAANFTELDKLYADNKIPILMPSQLFIALNPFRYTNRVSSDSMSLYCSYLIDAKALIVLKSIDGIYDCNSTLLNTLSYAEFMEIEQKCTDETFPVLLSNIKIETHIINGLTSEALLEILETGATKHGTKIF